MTDATPNFHCELYRDGDVVRIMPVGELDVGTVAAVEERVNQALAGGTRRLVLDLAGLTFMASTGLRLVLRLVERAAEAGIELSVVPGPRQVQRIFDLTKTEHAVPWAEH